MRRTLDELATRVEDELRRVEVARLMQPDQAPDYPTVREVAERLGLSVERTHAALALLRGDGRVVMHAGWGLSPRVAVGALASAYLAEHRLKIEAAHETAQCQAVRPSSGERCRLPGVHVAMGTPHEAIDGYTWGLAPAPREPLYLSDRRGQWLVRTEETDGAFLTTGARITDATKDGAGQPVFEVEVEDEITTTTETAARNAHAELLARWRA